MASARIGALRVDLGMNTAAFEKGVTLAERKIANFGKNMGHVGEILGNVGKKMTMGLTAPLLGVGAALVLSAKNLVTTSREMRVASQVAGEGFEDFQRLAFGAKTVGIEATKLGDIFKDVQDKVGDFRATGGGGMADFFENIAPKVGITAEAFKGLSGKDGLQLYYDSLVKANVSSDEMRFYMEAIASDATMLIPLLEQGGKAFDELGKSASVISEEEAARLEDYALASAKMEAAIQNLTIALVGSGLLEAVTGIVTKITEWTNWLAEVNPELLNMGLMIGGVTAALGPILVSLGSFLTIAGKLAPVIGLIGKALIPLAMNPAILALAGVIAAIYFAWKHWDKIEPILRDLYNGVKNWIQDKLGAVLGWVVGKVKTVRDAFANLYDAVVGNSYIPDMVDGIARHMRRLDAVMVAPVTAATTAAQEAFRDMASNVQGILDRLFPEVRRLLNYRDDLAAIEGSDLDSGTKAEARRRLRFELAGESATGKVGLSDQVREALFSKDELGGLDEGLRSFERFADRMKSEADTVKVTVVRTFGEMAEQTLGALDRLSGAIKGGGFLDIFSGIVGLGLQLGGAGAFGKGIAANINSFGGARAMGGPVSLGKSYLVGENGPEMFSPGQSGHIVPNHAMGGTRVEIIPSPYFDAVVDQRAAGVVSAAAPGIASAGAQAAHMQSAKAARWQLK